MAGLRLDQALARLLPEESRSRLARLIEEGHVQVDGEPAEVRRKVRSGEAVELWLAPRPADTAHAPEAIDLAIVHEDEHLLVVDKPAGLVVHPGSGNWEGTMLNALLHHVPAVRELPRAGIVHRLDKDTSGLLVVAKTEPAQLALVRQLQARTVKRTYLALARGRVERDGTVEAPIGRHPVHRTRMAVVASGKPAVAYPNSGESWDGATRAWGGDGAGVDPAAAARWVAAGARYVGGCCRVGATDIARLAATMQGGSGPVSGRSPG